MLKLLQHFIVGPTKNKNTEYFNLENIQQLHAERLKTQAKEQAAEYRYQADMNGWDQISEEFTDNDIPF